MMPAWLAVLVGGGVGSVLRYSIGLLLEECKKLRYYMDRLTAAATAVDQNAKDKGIT